MIKITEEKRFEALSPFELKNKLIQLASSHQERMMLNAGRGNPNWVANIPRDAFFLFGHFAVEESERNAIRPTFGSFAKTEGLEKRFEDFLNQHEDDKHIVFLKKAFDYVRNELKIDGDKFVCEMVDAILGDHYPYPDRMLECCEIITQKYIDQEMCANNPPPGKIDLFPTEGGTAAMDYIFNSLMENKLLHKGDKIALGSPIFTPYIEIPRLNDYEFVELEIVQDENNYWQYPNKELEKLLDPKVKAFFLVHPSNPTAVCMHQDSLEKIADLVKTKRPDLILLTDDVYGTFVNGFKSLISIAPHNTILVYSYSKYFGATGWRLGVIGIHENNVFDKMIARLPRKDFAELHKRYSTVELDPDKMKLIDRMVADSRSVALHHTAGLSTPQQVLIAFFSLYCLIDKENKYKQTAQEIVKHRFELLYKAIGIDCPENKYGTHYYTIIDIPKLAATRYDQKFADYLEKTFEPIDFVMRLASEKSVVLLNGGGFDAPDMSVRVSLANLPDDEYTKIGEAISELLEEYYKYWQKKK
ncbi:MAG: bifunctional aspartate transaminase/aspartate 4-decarboxylase [Gammaproteobacteria bacterium]|jgi:aspartate 4-decarboxylase